MRCWCGRRGGKASNRSVFVSQQAGSARQIESGERIVAPIASKLVKVDTKSGAAVMDSESPRPLTRFETDIRQSLRAIDERRQTMDTLAAGRKRQQTGEMPLASLLKRNALLVALALAGLALATWHLMRR